LELSKPGVPTAKGSCIYTPTVSRLHTNALSAGANKISLRSFWTYSLFVSLLVWGLFKKSSGSQPRFTKWQDRRWFP